MYALQPAGWITYQFLLKNIPANENIEFIVFYPKKCKLG